VNPAWLDAVVLLRLGAGTCSGALVAPDRVLTAWHCVAPGGRPSVEWPDGARAVGRVVGADRDRDLALVAVPAQARPILPVSPALPTVGEAVHALGHPLASDPPEGFYEGTLRWSATGGEVAAVGVRAVQLTAPLAPGHSGGPVVDGAGRVVGVVSRRLSGGPSFAGRVDGVPAELAAPSWGAGRLGGTLSAHLVGFDQPTPDGLVAGGGRLELAIHDRVWLAAGAFAPWAPVTTAERFGAARSVVAEGLIGVRQRLGRGPWSGAVDAFAGTAAIGGWSRAGGDVRGAVEPGWLVGGRLGARGVALELSAAPGGELFRAGVVVRWPGTLAVF
jgi:hypothetical protein